MKCRALSAAVAMLSCLSVALLWSLVPKSSSASPKRGTLRICSSNIPPSLVKKLDESRKQQPATDNFHPELAVLKNYIWPPNERTLQVRFLGGDSTIQKKVIASADKWILEANVPVKFVFGEEPSAQIRISFDPNTGSWSMIGTQAKFVEAGKATMNFGWLADDTPDDEYDRVVIHEFGHALGAIHEHQNPNGKPICWDKPAVYRYFADTNGWDQATVNRNIFDRYDPKELSATTTDLQSIMMYGFPKELTCDRTGTPWNTKLSDQDKTFMHSLYK